MACHLAIVCLASAAALAGAAIYDAPEPQQVMVSSAYLTYAASAVSTLQLHWYNETNGLWDSTGWWNAANCLTIVADYASIDPSFVPQAEQVFQNTLYEVQHYEISLSKMVSPQRQWVLKNKLPPQNGELLQLRRNSTYAYSGALATLPFPDFLNDFYDDEGWWALAWIRAYDITNNLTYLSTAETIFDDMAAAWGNNSCRGGLQWNKHLTLNNAIENELFLSVAAHLASRTNDTAKKESYLNWALQEWEWFQSTEMINENFNINDGIDNVTCMNNHGIIWSYNQGVILGGLAELFKVSPNPSYITAASNIATAAIALLCDSNGILHDPCEPKCLGDGEQFKGVFMRNLYYLYEAAPQELYLQTIQKNADSIWVNDREISSGHLGEVWSGPYEYASAGAHSSATDALVAAAKVELQATSKQRR